MRKILTAYLDKSALMDGGTLEANRSVKIVVELIILVQRERGVRKSGGINQKVARQYVLAIRFTFNSNQYIKQ